MQKINKTVNIALIFMLIGVVAKPECVYPDAQYSLLRPALQFNKLSRGPKRLFTGSFGVAIDTSGKIRIPYGLAGQFPRRIMLQFVNEYLIRIFSYEQWEAVTAQAPPDIAQRDEYERGMHASVYYAEMKSALRIHMPEALRKRTKFKLGSRAIMIGVGDHIELIPEETFVYPETHEIPARYKGPLVGTYDVAMNEGVRFSIPIKLREQLPGNELILQFVNRDLIRIFSYEQWSKAMTAQAPHDPGRLAEYNYRICAFAYFTKIDNHNRVRIPDELKTHTNFEEGLGAAVITGVGGSIEIAPKQSSLSIAPADIRTGL